jgi:hypothetical protein
MWVAKGQRAGITPRRIDGILESFVPSLEIIERMESHFMEKVFSGAWNP